MGQACNCTTMDKYSLLQYSPCKPNDPCVTNKSKMFSTNEFIRENCLNLCPLQCNRTLYPIAVSSSMLIGDYYIEKIANNSKLREDFVTREINAENAKNSVVRVYIFYQSLSYTESVEVVTKPSILSLAANIGGILSLFLGVSVMSLFEVCEIFIELYMVR